MSSSKEIIGDMLFNNYVRIRDKSDGREFLLPRVSWIWFQKEQETGGKHGTLIEFTAIIPDKFILAEAARMLDSISSQRCVDYKNAETGEWNFELVEPKTNPVVVATYNTVYEYLYEHEEGQYQRMTALVMAAPGVTEEEVVAEVEKKWTGPMDILDSMYAEGEFKKGVPFRAHITSMGVSDVIRTVKSDAFNKDYDVKAFAKEMVGTRQRQSEESKEK